MNIYLGVPGERLRNCGIDRAVSVPTSWRGRFSTTVELGLVCSCDSAMSSKLAAKVMGCEWECVFWDRPPPFCPWGSLCTSSGGGGRRSSCHPQEAEARRSLDLPEGFLHPHLSLLRSAERTITAAFQVTKKATRLKRSVRCSC